jgi:hypothetical protein
MAQSKRTAKQSQPPLPTHANPVDFEFWRARIDRWPPILAEVGVGPCLPATCEPPYSADLWLGRMQPSDGTQPARWWIVRLDDAAQRPRIRHELDALAAALGMTVNDLVEEALHAVIRPQDWRYYGRDWFEGKVAPPCMRLPIAPENLHEGAREFLRQNLGTVWWAVAQELPLDWALLQFVQSQATKQGRTWQPADASAGAAQPAATASPSDSLKEAASYAALLRVYTNGLSDDRIAAAAQVVANKRLSVNNKLYKLDKLLPIPSTASAAVLAELFDISKQAVMKTAWWAEHRSGEGAAKVEQRRAIHHDRAAQLERPDEDG